jgi:hypothetical protein
MYEKDNEMAPAQKLYPRFDMREAAGVWRSREGSPAVRIFHNDTRKKGGYLIEVAYDRKTVLRRPIRHLWGNIRYFDLWGRIVLFYDAGRDVLTLTGYGDYYREEE